MVGSYTFLRWFLRLLLDRASSSRTSETVWSKSLRNASRFFAALISAWFCLDILNCKAKVKVDRKDSKQAAQDQQYDVADGTGLSLQTERIDNSKFSKTAAPVLARKTIDLTFLAVTRALDSLVVNLYRRSYPSFADTAPAFSTVTAISRHADTFIFALSSGTVVCLQPGAILLRFLSDP